MRTPLFVAGLLAMIVLAACDSEAPAAAPQGSRATPVTAQAVSRQRVEVLERSVGRLEAPSTPSVAAETSARVVAVHVDAGSPVQAGQPLADLDSEVQRNNDTAARANVDRLQVLLENQGRTVERIRDLVQRELAAESSLDDAVAQQSALKAQLDEARARLADAKYNLQHTQVLSPIDGIVQTRRVSVGDFVSVGQPLFELVAADRLRAIVPYPETSASSLAEGQVAYIAPVRAPQQRITAAVTELRPGIGALSRSVDVIVEFDNPGGWRPGGSVTVDIVVDTREDSLTVPSECVVRRPAGTVVYVVEDGTARQRVVTTGVQSDDWTEILDGLEPREQVIRSGAGFMTDGAKVEVVADAQDAGIEQRAAE
jgi:membrane fusion protein (multidrug efflux system)